MIRVTEIIELLRNELQGWSVDGAVDLAIAEDSSRLPLPCMYVGLAPFTCQTVSFETYEQTYKENFFIITCTPTTPSDDRTGKYAQDFVYVARMALLSILGNNKDLDPESHAIMFERDLPEKLDRARYYHRFEFSVTGRFLPEDVRPLDLDVFDTMFNEYVPSDATDETPPVEQLITPIYYTTE
jgi:hypothetical protein